ncbi:MAG: frzE [Planctomycetaceae bacterium]|nr:frzE [Planctomycetaceae bacterium]
MPNILVADDSPVERSLYTALILKHIPFADVVQAADGAQVLAEIERTDFDLILTDFQMPKVDGIEVLQQTARIRPGLPVVVMTGCGSEATAIRALQAGAASYLIKGEISQRLIETINNVLAMSKSRHNRRRMLSSLSNQSASFVLHNDVSLVAPLIIFLQEQLQVMELCNDSLVTRIGVALHESLTNAIYHGNLELSSELRQEDEAIFYELADQRRFDAPYCNRCVRVEAFASRDSISYTIRDEGPGFDINKVKDPTADENIFSIGGRGLLLIRSFMDQVTHNSRGNEITMVKHLKPVAPPASPVNSELQLQTV